MAKVIPLIAASARLAVLFPSLGKFLAGDGAEARIAGNSGGELPGKLRYDVGLADCRLERKAPAEHDVIREMMRRSF